MKFSMRAFLFSAAILVAPAVATLAHAAPVTWDLQNVTFNDGGTASGFFTYNADINEAVDWLITTTPTVDLAADGGYGLSGATYSPVVAPGAAIGNSQGYTFESGSSLLGFVFADMLTDAGGTIALKAGFEDANRGFESRSIAGGELVSVSAVPEPATWAFMLLGIGGIGAALRIARRAMPASTC